MSSLESHLEPELAGPVIKEPDATALNALSGNILRPIIFSQVGFFGAKGIGQLADKLEKLADVNPVPLYNQAQSLIRSGIFGESEMHQNQRRPKTGNGRNRIRAVVAEDAELYLPVAGVLLRWSLLHEHSNAFLGKTAHERHAVRTPVITAELLAGLLETPHLDQIEVPELQRSRAAENERRLQNAKNERAMALVKLGLLRREEGGRFFQIVDPEYRGSKSLTASTQAAYGVLTAAHEGFDRSKVWSPDELAQLAVARGIVSPEDTEVIRRMKVTLSEAASPHRLDVMPGALEKAPMRKTAYYLTPDFKPKAEDFVERIGSLSDPHARVAASVDAMRISYNSKNIKQLIAIDRDS